MELGNIVQGSPHDTVGTVEVSFSDSDGGSVGYFTVDKLLEALIEFDKKSDFKDGAFVRLGTAAYQGDEIDREIENLLVLQEDPDDDVGVVVAPRFKAENKSNSSTEESKSKTYKATD